MTALVVTVDGVHVPRCADHEPVWVGARSRDMQLARLNANIHNTDVHPKVDEPTLFEVTE